MAFHNAGFATSFAVACFFSAPAVALMVAESGFRFEEGEGVYMAQQAQYAEFANIGRPAAPVKAGAFGFSDRVEGKVSSGQLPWSPIPELLGDGSKNLCRAGRLLPQLYLLGAAKAATTSLAADLQGAGVETVGHDCRISEVDKCGADGKRASSNKKEFHFFDFSMAWKNWSREQYDEMVENVQPKWLNTMPTCSTRQRRVVADYTPENMRLVPMPNGVSVAGNFVGRSFKPWQLMSNNTAKAQVHLPNVLHSLYGPNQASQVTFVVMLREPASRMQSHWYCCVCPTVTRVEGGRCEGRTFEGDMAFTVRNAHDGIYNDWLWYSLYDEHLSQWFKVWDPSRFYIVPYKQFSTGNKDAICTDLSQRLDYAMDCNSGGTAATWIGADPNGKPAVQQDLSEELWASYERFITPVQERLVSILADAHVKGAGLANYEGSPGSVADVKPWLYGAW